jgi:hypothetical protein
MLRTTAILALLLLASCTTAPPGNWYRVDGQTLTDRDQLNWTACKGEQAKAFAYGGNQAGDYVIQGCMADRGYVWR